MTCRDGRCDGVLELALELTVRYTRPQINDASYISAALSIAEFRILVILTEINGTC